jgi:hypothetical protein
MCWAGYGRECNCRECRRDRAEDLRNSIEEPVVETTITTTTTTTTTTVIKRSEPAVKKPVKQATSYFRKNYIENPIRHYLDVPFSEKDDVKELGARWDDYEGKWYSQIHFRNHNELIERWG